MYQKYDEVRINNAIKKAKELALQNKGLSSTIVQRLKSYYVYSKNNYPESTINYLNKILPAYGLNKEQCVNFINNNVALVFTNTFLLESKLSIYHLVNVERDVLFNHPSAIVNGKVRDLYNNVEILKHSYNRSDSTTEETFQELKSMGQNKSEDGEFSYNLTQNALDKAIISYRRFISASKIAHEQQEPDENDEKTLRKIK